jgi:hypothetical protein
LRLLAVNNCKYAGACENRIKHACII